jgi:hypothetical protein
MDEELADRRLESIDFQQSRPLDDADGEMLAMALEEQKQEARGAVDDATMALLNEEKPLTGETVAELGDAAERLSALARTLVMRVPSEHAVDE